MICGKKFANKFKKENGSSVQSSDPVTWGIYVCILNLIQSLSLVINILDQRFISNYLHKANLQKLRWSAEFSEVGHGDLNSVPLSCLLLAKA